MKLLFITLISGMIVCCEDKETPRTHSSVVSGWANLGVNLPADKDVQFIRETLPDSLTSLESGISNKSQNVRMASAYVAEKLGYQAHPLVSVMIERIRSETDSLVRVYLASAIATIGHADLNDVRKLEVVFQSEANEQAKTDIAGALVRLRSTEEEPLAWDWLLESLKAFPPDPPSNIMLDATFWERRWGAVKHARAIREKDSVVLPLLNALKSNPSTPRWVVDQQITPAIAEIAGRNANSKWQNGQVP